MWVFPVKTLPKLTTFCVPAAGFNYGGVGHAGLERDGTRVLPAALSAVFLCILGAKRFTFLRIVSVALSPTSSFMNLRMHAEQCSRALERVQADCIAVCRVRGPVVVSVCTDGVGRPAGFMGNLAAGVQSGKFGPVEAAAA